MKAVASTIILLATSINDYWANKIKDQFGIKISVKESGFEMDPTVLRQIYLILLRMSSSIVKDCGVHDFFLKNLGPSKPFYPNHGYFVPKTGTITFNINIFIDPDQPEDFTDSHGFFVNRAVQTVFHEMAHAFDENKGNLSGKSNWMKLSGWSKEPKPGLKRLIIQEPGTPPVLGEMYFDPEAGFPRFYAKRNNWDDFADCFAFYLAGLQDKLPENKQEYFKKLFLVYKK